MLSISTMFEEEYSELEKQIEEISFQCTKLYGDNFVEAAIKYLEEDNYSEIDVYFESYSSLVELKVPYVDVKKAYDDVKNIARKEAGKKPKRSLIRSATNMMYKNKIGRAIVRGIRKAGYGTKLGRKIMKTAGKIRSTQRDLSVNMARNMAKESVETKAAVNAIKRKVPAEKLTKGDKFNLYAADKLSNFIAKGAGKKARDARSYEKTRRSISTGLGVTRKGFKNSQMMKANKGKLRYATA